MNIFHNETIMKVPKITITCLGDALGVVGIKKLNPSSTDHFTIPCHHHLCQICAYYALSYIASIVL